MSTCCRLKTRKIGVKVRQHEGGEVGGGYEHSIMRPSHQLKVDVRSGGTGLGRGTRNEFS